IPDGIVCRVVDWAIEGARREPRSRDGAQKVAASWQALATLMYRCSDEQADRAASIALGHPLLNTPNTYRRDLIRFARFAFSKLSLKTKEMLLPLCMRLLGPEKHDLDYDDALQLAGSIAVNSPVEMRTRLADALLPRDTPISDLKLARLVPLLDRQ